ncbi:tetraspanin-19 isoform X1 [Gallus gallus]|uniref:Tetraspanin n=1 Tax=Gallus gallus TaxID=9031 RepID=A0A8V0Y8E5_CHICK|nr:tetraspanin-19 isoform X1 [Gallus gallus]XP_040511029.1 tetraspanin-19 isoform X1 [Gallus gallus]XP_040511034.1 tetraspanin-19 isoform X1 [Gallus gallus]
MFTEDTRQLQFKTENRRMKIRDKLVTWRITLTVFNGIFLALGVMVLTFGLWLLFDRNNLFGVLFSSGENQLVARVSFMLLGVGSLIIFTSVVGFLGTVKEIRCLLVTYVCFQVLVFFTQIAISALIFLKKEVVYHQWNNRIDEVISEYGNKSLAEKEPVWNILNSVQQNMECCGRYNFTQWEKNKNMENRAQIPCSCTKSNLKKWFCDIPRNSTYSMGCEEYLDTWFENNVLILNGISISLLITQVFVITLTMKLLINIRRNSIWPNE